MARKKGIRSVHSLFPYRAPAMKQGLKFLIIFLCILGFCAIGFLLYELFMNTTPRVHKIVFIPKPPEFGKTRPPQASQTPPKKPSHRVYEKLSITPSAHPQEPERLLPPSEAPMLEPASPPNPPADDLGDLIEEKIKKTYK